MLYYTFIIIKNLIKQEQNIYYLHRYGDKKKIFRLNLFYIFMMIIIFETVFLIINISVSLFRCYGFYIISFKYSGISNICYLVYSITFRFIYVYIVNILIYCIYYIKMVF